MNNFKYIQYYIQELNGILKRDGINFVNPCALFANEFDAVPKITAKNK